MIVAYYYDGQVSRRMRVELMIHRGVAAISGEQFKRSVLVRKLKISEPLQHAPRILRLPDGAVIESEDPALERLLRKNGYREPAAVKWQRNWPASLLALVTLLAVLLAGYQWGLPWAADTIAQQLPHSLEKRIGDEAWHALDSSSRFRPSQLQTAQQERLRQAFAGLEQPHGGKTSYRLEFRAGEIGPNAFALPNGLIVVTDDLVRLAGDERAVLGVLAHELGHLENKHAMRRLLQTVGVGVVVNLVLGDVSSVLVAAPTFLLDQKYSRDFEREADQYAIDMMRANRVPLTPMAALFEKMHAAESTEEKADDDDEEESDGGFDYLSSHPSDAERIARLKAADVR